MHLPNDIGEILWWGMTMSKPETKEELQYGETTYVEDLLQMHAKAAETVNAFNELARKSGIAGNLYELKVNNKFWRALLKQARDLDRKTMANLARLVFAPTKSIN
jgi:hypothetical protein